MKRILALLALVVVPLTVVATAFAADAIIGCKQSHTNFDDLIMFPGQPGASHQHVYVGARSNNAFSTVGSMRASGTTCDNSRDTAGYWGPTSAAGYPIHPSKGALFYYTFNGTNGFPEGFRMIVRWTHGGDHVLFRCGPGGGPDTRVPPSTCRNGMAVPVVRFPTWYDGRLDSPDHISHTSYSQTSTHRFRLPKIVAYWRLAVPPGPVNWNFSSGNYQTFHLDFFSTGPIR